MSTAVEYNLSASLVIHSEKIHSDPKLVKEQKFLDVKWKEYEETILTLALKIFASEWVPDQIVCIGRGGMSLGDALSRLFKKTVGVRMCSSYGGEGEMEKKKLIIAEHISIVKGLSGKILLVDDLTDSGDSLKLNQQLLGLVTNIVDVKTAVIYKKTCSEFTPDYHGKVIEKGVWIYLPNEIFDRVNLNNIPKEKIKSFSDESLNELAKGILDSLPWNPLHVMPKETYTELVSKHL